MQFSLRGFRQNANLRLYSFQGLDGDYTRHQFTVRVDLDLARRYAICIQELPLLCRELLDKAGLSGGDTLTFSEQDMLYVANRREETKSAGQRKLQAE